MTGNLLSFDFMSNSRYITIRFSGGKLDFSLINDTLGFSLIDGENQNEFIDSFRKFEELDWNAIATDNGLDYKPYNKNKKSKRYFSDNGRKALKNSESLSGTDVLVMWIMIFFMC
ncbi:hypothetical protein AAH095_13845 [Phocaeicola vulgatus]